MKDTALPFDLERQNRFCEDIRPIMQVRARGSRPMALVRTYGCQQNVADSEIIKGFLAQMGFDFTENEDEADFILFNTCAIREHAVDRVFGNVGALKNCKRRHPSLIIAVCGCMAEQEKNAERIRHSYPFVNLVFGTHMVRRFPELLHDVLINSRRIVKNGGEEEDREIVEGLPVLREGGYRAWLTIMYGCDNFCSYCVVPLVRGRERSRKPEAIEAEFRQLVAEGYKEITLLGQNVNSYGKGLEEPFNFSELLRRLDQVPGDYRIRFMTSHPKDATFELFDTIASSKHICHHIHLPFQSGNDRVLKEMNRHYDREKYLSLVRYAKEKMPDLSLTSDIIVGFPGETYEEFCDTLSLIREVEFTSLFTFIFSPRPGTKAEKMEDPVPYEEKNRWFQELLRVQEEIAARRCAEMVGREERVLVEERNPKNGLLCGRTESSIIVEFEGEDAKIGTFCRVKITRARNWILQGEEI